MNKRPKIFLDHNILLLKQKQKEKIYVDDIKYTLKTLKLNNKGKKNELLNSLLLYYNKESHYHNNIDKIIFLQKRYRNKIKIKNDNFYKQFTNTEDFYTLDSLTKIEKPYLFWFEEKEFKWVFDIRSFKQLIINKCKNPYNRETIPEHAIEKYHKRIIEMKEKNIKLDNYEDDTNFMTKEQKQNLKIMDIFQKLDELNIVAGGINQEFFKEFTFTQLKSFYKVLEDVWNYRSELSYQKKLNIVPTNNLFKQNIYYIINLHPNNYILLQNIILDEIDILISSAHNLENKRSGGYYVLITLTEVSQNYANEYPWLKQY
jgi:hypothetical protein